MKSIWVLHVNLSVTSQLWYVSLINTVYSFSLRVCLFVRPSMTLCIVATCYILQHKCLNKWTGSAPRNTILQRSTPTLTLFPQTNCPQNFIYLLFAPHFIYKCYKRLCLSETILFILLRESLGDVCLVIKVMIGCFSAIVGLLVCLVSIIAVSVDSFLIVTSFEHEMSVRKIVMRLRITEIRVRT